MDHYLKEELFALVGSDRIIFDFIQEEALEGLWLWDLEKDQFWLNSKGWSLLGYNPDRLPSSAIAEFRSMIVPVIETCLKKSEGRKKNPLEVAVKYKKADNTEISVKCLGKLIYNKQQRPVRLLIAQSLGGTPPTDSGHQEMSVRRLQNMLNVSGGLAFVVNQDLTITSYYCNEDEIELDLDTIIGKRIGQIDFHVPAKKVISEAVEQALKSGEKIETEYALVVDEQSRYFQLQVSRTEAIEGDAYEAVAAIRDITKWKAATLKLIDGQKQLDFFFNNSLYGAFFMMLDQPIEWHESADKEKLIDYALAHQKITRVNQAMLDQYRASGGAFLGLTPYDFFTDEKATARNLWKTLFDQGNYRVQTREKRFDGTDIYVEGHYICLYDDLGRIIGHFGIQQDVTQQQETINALKESEARNKSYVENAPYGVFIVDQHGNYLEVNKASESLTGYSSKELLSMQLTALCTPNDEGSSEKILKQLFKCGYAYGTTLLRLKSGSERHFSINAIRLSDQRYIGFVEDVNEQYLAQIALQKSKNQFRMLLNSTEEGIYGTNQKGICTFCNKASLRMLGYDKPEDLLGKNMHDLVHHTDQQKHKIKSSECIIFTNTIAGHKTHTDETVFWRSNNTSFPAEVWSHPVIEEGKITGTVVTFIDISSRKEAERKLKQSQEHYRLLSDLTVEGVLIHDNGKAVDCNKSFARMFGYQQDELLGKNIIPMIVHTEDLEIVTRNMAKEKSAPYLVRGIRKDGSIFPGEVEGRNIYYDDRHLRVAAVRDVSERFEAQEQLTKSQRQLQKLTDNVPGILFQLLMAQDGAMKFTYISKHVEQLGAGKLEALLANPLSAFDDIHPDDLPAFKQSIADAKEHLSIWDIEYRVIRSDQLLWFKGLAQPELQKSGEILWSGIIQNITMHKQMLDTIRTEKLRLNNILEGTRAGTWEWHIQTGEILVNEYWEKITGYQLSEIEPVNTRTWISLIHPKDKKKSDQLLKAHLEGRLDYYECEVRIKHKDGHWIWILDRGKITETSEDGKPLVMAGTQQDISERKEAEAESAYRKEQLQKLTENIPESLFQLEIDPASTLSVPFISNGKDFLSGSITTNIMTDPEKGFKMIYPEDMEKVYQAIYRSKETLEELNVEFRFKDDEGNLQWDLINAQPGRKPDGTVVWYGICMDVTRKKQFEQDLNNAKVQAEAASIAKSDFLANMSHEIRTPLNGVIGFTDLLLKTKLDATQEQYMKTVHQSANTLLEIISDILDFSKIEAGKLELFIDKADLMSMAGNITDLVKYQAHKKGLEILLNIDPALPRFVFADEVRLKQILVNLLGNAVKFTNHGEIELKIELLKKVSETEGEFRFSVRDTGVGIGERNQKKIFEAFAQEDVSTTRKYGGTGLGLSISNKLLAMMNSQLQLESKLGKGSIFFFELQLKVDENESMGYPWADLHRQIHSILVVDDNQNNRDIMHQMLNSGGIKVETVANGLDALDRLVNDNNYDVVLMDYQMPYLNGLEVARKIREELKLSAIEQPIILVHSSSENEAMLKECRELGIKQILIKPVSRHQLFEGLLKLIHHPSKVMSEEIPASQEMVFSNLKGRILIAEDNDINLLLARTIIREILPAMEIIEASDGNMALDLFEKHQPDLVLMDIQMPGMNGYDATRAIRKIDKKHIPIIALTAGTVKGEEEKCIAAGMNDYASKPVVKQALYEIVKKWLLKDQELVKGQEQVQAESSHFEGEALKEKFSQNYDFVDSLLDKTMVYLDILLKEMGENFEKKKLKELKEQAHSLKGTSASVGLPRLNELTTDLMQLCDQQDLNLVQVKIVELAQEIPVVIQEMEEMRQELLKIKPDQQ